MKETTFVHIFLATLACLSAFYANAEDPYRYYTWEVTYGKISPLGVPQQVCYIAAKLILMNPLSINIFS